MLANKSGPNADWLRRQVDLLMVRDITGQGHLIVSPDVVNIPMVITYTAKLVLIGRCHFAEGDNIYRPYSIRKMPLGMMQRWLSLCSDMRLIERDGKYMDLRASPTNIMLLKMLLS